MHYFCHALNESGYEAYIVAPGRTNPHLRTPTLTIDIVKQHHTAGYVPIGVYPEVIPGNPLDFPVVARWVMNKPGHLGGDTHYDDNEMIFYWEDWMMEPGQVADMLQVPIIDLRIFNNRNPVAKRQGFCYYASKYLKKTGKKPSPFLVKNGTSLCLDIPRSPQEIAEIFRTAEAFYCYEPSSLLLEASACDCPSALVDTPYLADFNWEKNPFSHIKEQELWKIRPPAIDKASIADHFQSIDIQAWLQIENFIAKTQAAARRASLAALEKSKPHNITVYRKWLWRTRLIHAAKCLKRALVGPAT